MNIITGHLGAGKTTAIARLLATKPVAARWVVILNEFTDSGIDTLTLAAAAQGAYDLRMIPGGCLCCTGEEDFRQQLSALLAQPSDQLPLRILIEPSGIAHPGFIVEELRGFERSGALQLCSTIALLDAQTWSVNAGLEAVMAEQVNAADVVLLSKAELAAESTHQQFMQWAQSLFPAKRYVGLSIKGELPAAALSPPEAVFDFEMRFRPLQRAPEHSHDHATQDLTQNLAWCHQSVKARALSLLGRQACGWMVPASLLFDLRQLQELLAQQELWQGVERFKALLRTGVERWHLVQRWGRQYSIEVSTWRQDSRIELQLAEGVGADWQVWHLRWETLCELCPIA